MGAEEELKMQSDEAVEGPPSPPNPNPNPSSPTRPVGGGGYKGKSCKGCLYYSSVQKSKSKRPTCVGISRSLQQVPRYIVGETELQASKEGRGLSDFRYACVGYSIFLEKNAQSSDQQTKQAELPFCVGLEVLLDKRTTPAPQVQEHAHKRDDGHAIPQRQTYKPSSSTGDDYASRFMRNASLVASGVARNVNKVQNYIKETVDDILSPYRRPPK
ncbi:uncharacterized protein LOC116204092 isoform X2 [Punica granatum]|uniref:DUF8204 domain-containing protein n=2 Tax=Punica granatum TaxID=22663 RepID=A0A218XG05_PUNGR|nr:uncharacterized protein LOC116204092 isoform X2 [Punica granatum]OWM83897.1 hypothetical protein CDL15_Pgr004328 [Punica granatum]PKI54742.1 hypothetical protein CRG98_024844 [Punica granatum]